MKENSLSVRIFEALKYLLEKLILDYNIFGYIACFTLLCLIAAVKITIICLFLKKMKKCKMISSLEQDIEMKI